MVVMGGTVCPGDPARPEIFLTLPPPPPPPPPPPGRQAREILKTNFWLVRSLVRSLVMRLPRLVSSEETGEWSHLR